MIITTDKYINVFLCYKRLVFLYIIIDDIYIYLDKTFVVFILLFPGLDFINIYSFVFLWGNTLFFILLDYKLLRKFSYKVIWGKKTTRKANYKTKLIYQNVYQIPNQRLHSTSEIYISPNSIYLAQIFLLSRPT